MAQFDNPSPIIEMTGIDIAFPGVKALDDVRFRLFPGEIHSLMGENGAGKSTVIKALTGVYKIDAGSMKMNGQEIAFLGPGDAERHGIATVYQEVNLCGNLTIGENLMLGHEVRSRFGIDWKASHKVAREALKEVGLGDIDTYTPLSSVSIAKQQLVAIARATVVDAKVLILDEPTSSLDDEEVRQLYAIMRQLVARGVAILFVTHFLDQVYDVADRMTILRNGQFVKECLVKDTPREQTILLMIGRSMESLATLESGTKDVRFDYQDKPPCLEVSNFGRKGELHPSSLTLRPGQIEGLAGLLGSGRTEFARLLFGADKADSGEYRLAGRKVSISSPFIALKSGIAYSTENRRDEGLLNELTVRENIIVALQSLRGWARPISRKEQLEICGKYIDLLQIKTPSTETPIASLSGGNQQKVLLARWLCLDPQVLILDEPTRGIDIGAKSEIMEFIHQLANEGRAVVFISSELGEVVRICDTIVIMRDTRQIATVENSADFTAADIVTTICGEPETAELGDRQ